jgi:hypothetical protein
VLVELELSKEAAETHGLLVASRGRRSQRMGTHAREPEHAELAAPARQPRARVANAGPENIERTRWPVSTHAHTAEGLSPNSPLSPFSRPLAEGRNLTGEWVDTGCPKAARRLS